MGQAHRVGFLVGSDGNVTVTLPARSSNPKFDVCFDKAVSSIKIPAGATSIKGTALLRLGKGDAELALSIQPDPSELSLPPSVRRFAGCACGGIGADVVCAIECRSGAGPGGGGTSVGMGIGGDTDYDTSKRTAPSSIRKDPFADKTTAPAKPAKAAPAKSKTK